jgi:Ca2+-binding EF-hand superfamily protein
MMIHTKKLLSAVTLAGLVAASLSTVAMAQGRGGDHMGPMFDFAAMDVDADGRVTKGEVAAYRTARLTAMDTDKDGNLSAAELTAGQAEQDQKRGEKRAARMLERQDANKDGVLSLAEMTPAAGRVDKMFDRVDTDKDGAITKVEADVAMEKRAARMEKRGGKHGEGRSGDRKDDKG